MRRVGNLWDRIVSFPNLMAAARRAAKGKRTTRGAARFLDRLESEVLRLERELNDGTWQPGVAHSFEIHDPKTRTITAAPFRDRVVHHALMDVLGPVFEKRMLDASYACRVGKGTHAALRSARRLVRTYDWFLKLDIKKCFPSIRHDVVIESVARCIKDRRVIALCRTILEGAPTGSSTAAAGIGIPIGNLTSQWFANVVLDRLDHHVKEVLRVPGYLRYMDDFALFAPTKEALASALVDVRCFVEQRLRLELKDRATILAPVDEGMPFLGFRVYRGMARLRPATAQRTRDRMRRREAQHRHGWIDADQLARSTQSMVAHLEHGTTRAWRRALFSPPP
jgi:RNA-directed DNA polymerase